MVDVALEELGVDIEIDDQQSPREETAETPASDLATTSRYAKIMSASPTEEPISEPENLYEPGVEHRTGKARQSSPKITETSQETATDLEGMKHDVPPTDTELEADTEDEPVTVGNEEVSTESRDVGDDGHEIAYEDDTPGNDIPLAELEMLLEKIRFMQKVLERESEAVSGDQDDRLQSQLAVIHEIKSRIETIIDK